VGPGALPSSHSRHTPTQVPSAATTATPIATPTIVPTPSPTAVPTPLPEPPLAVLSQGQEVEVVKRAGCGTVETANAQEGQFFGLTAQQANSPDFEVNAKEGGTDLFLFYQKLNTTITKVAVVLPNRKTARDGYSA